MSSSNPVHDDDDDQGDVFIDESDIVDEVTIDEEGYSFHFPTYTTLYLLLFLVASLAFSPYRSS